MGKATGFLDYNRKDDGDIPVSERIKTFDEFHTHLNEEERKEQGGRCMNCGVPMCQSCINLSGMFTGCPLHNNIPEWNDCIWRGDYWNGLERLTKTSNFPEFTGRVCPALCEKACICGMDSDPVTTHNNELFLIEKGFSEGWVKPRIPAVRSGKKIAVIGSGPAGLAVADTLNRRGHNVTVFEKSDRIGGLLMYGIPNQKLGKEIVDRRVKLMEEEGVEFKTSCDVGRKKKKSEGYPERDAASTAISAADILKEYDAVALCCGAKKARALDAKGIEKAAGVYFAVDYLSSNTKTLLEKGEDYILSFANGKGKGEPSFISAAGKNVVIVGGGDTGNDCLGTAIRQGAKSVTCIEMMPEPPEKCLPTNPWPEWPKVKKTDYGHEEAIKVFGADPRVYETTVKEVGTDESGHINTVTTVKVKFEDGKLVQVKGSEQVLPCDLLLTAAGFLGAEEYTAEAFGAGLDKRNRIVTEAGAYATSAEKVFTAGDMHRGQSLVVWAIAEGRACARAIDEYLMGYTAL